MPTASGFIKTAASGSKFTASFVIDDILYSYAGDISPSVQDFNCTNAILTYTSVSQLTTSRPYTGKIGINDVTLTTNNGPTITGPLDMPIAPASTVSGTGTWHQN